MRLLKVLSLLLVVAPASVLAQTTGTIEGTLVDDAGLPLAQATVEATSTSLQGVKVGASDAGGVFRLVFLPPGRYAVRCALPGFATVEQDGIQVQLGRTVSLQVRMQPAFHDEVTVSSEAPAIDVRSPEVGANVDRSFFLNLPLDRDYTSVVQATPGTTTDASGTVVYGSTGLENTYTIDGINTTHVFNSSSGPSPQLRVHRGGPGAHRRLRCRVRSRHRRRRQRDHPLGRQRLPRRRVRLLLLRRAADGTERRGRVLQREHTAARTPSTPSPRPTSASTSAAT